MCLAVPGKIISVEPMENPLFKIGQVSFDGVCREVSLVAVPEARVGDYVLVHVGMALSVIDEQEAKRTLEYLDEVNKLNSESGEESSADE